MELNKDQKRPYSVEPYNLGWITRFENIKQDLEGIFRDKPISIEHIGSTSVPGMKAKPVIDVLITVEKIESFEKEKEEMSKLGYLYNENYIAPNTIIFFKENEIGGKTENIHVCEKGSPKAIQFITTRDYLRSHPDRAGQYGDLKEENAKQFPNDYPTYRKEKQEFMDETENLTKEWLENKL